MNSRPQDNSAIKLPDGMLLKLRRFQRRVWIVKLCEGILAAAFGLLVSYLLVFLADRFIETPMWMRSSLLILGALGPGLWFPLVCHHWIWNSRRLDQVARMLRRRLPRLGDHLLGIIELVNSSAEQERSKELCVAALNQVDKEIEDRDFSDAVPQPRHKQWAWIAGVPAVLAAVAFVVVPSASTNALARWIMPWRNVERYTFAQLESLPEKLVVPTAERTSLQARLAESSRWRPGSGLAVINGKKMPAENKNDRFVFSIPPLKESSKVHVRVGDFRKTLSFEPMSRPELSSVTASITLPTYLQRSDNLTKDVRGGRLTVVEGSEFTIQGVATRPLESASIDGVPIQPNSDRINTETCLANKSSNVSLEWRDAYGLSAKSPLSIHVQVVEDQSPTLVCKRLENRKVIQEKEVLSFDVAAADDFGIKKVGLEWRGAGTDEDEAEVQGEKIVASGDADSDELSVLATFSPKREGISPRPISLRVFAEDFMPGRKRVYSPAYQVFVLSEDQHANWLSRRLKDWQKETLETFERETRLLNQNQAIREMSSAELDRPETRKQIEKQVAAEKAQERRLAALTRQGENLVEDAVNNDQFNVQTLESLAESIATLKQIAGNRMPSVADLLKKAANAQGGSSSNASMQVVDDQTLESEANSNTNSKPSTETEKKEPAPTPSITLKESSMDSPPEDENEKEDQTSSSSSPKLTLPLVTLKDNSPSKPGASSPAQKQMDEAVKEQENLVAEFAKVAKELEKLVTNLEGSTFVKRLKALSRKQLKLASDVNSTSVSKFGIQKQTLAQPALERSKTLSDRQSSYTEQMEYIYSDLEAYANRVSDKKYLSVLNEMKSEQPTEQIRDIARQIVNNEPGASISHAELLADTLDRWAEQMVGPG